MRISLIRVLFLVGLHSSLVWAETIDNDSICQNALEPLVVNLELFSDGPKGGNAVELEMPFSKKVRQLVTTSDGTVGGLFEEQDLPVFFKSWAFLFHHGQDPKSILWDSLSDRMRFQLLLTITKRKKPEFYKDRKIPNVRMKPNVDFTFHHTTSFMGHEYPSGRQTVYIEPYFKAVEYKSPKATRDMSGVELHLRSDALSAGEVFKSAWTFQDAINVSRTHLHEHIVAPVPIHLIEKDSVLTALSITELFRRANLLGEFVRIIKLKPIEHKETADGIWFSSIKSYHLKGIYNYLKNYIEHRSNPGRFYRMGYVGFRGHDFYDQENMHGFEVRFIRADDDPNLMEKFLNNIERGLRYQQYGFNPEWLQAHLKERGVILDSSPEERNRYFDSIWYRKTGEVQSVFSNFPRYLIKRLQSDRKTSATIYQLIEMGKKNLAAEMLIYDWKADPLLINEPEFQQKVVLTQNQALANFFKRPSQLNKILQVFIIESGLLEVIGKSFGLSPEDFQSTYQK